MARETENLGLYLADDEDTFQNYVKNQSASMNHNMEILDSYIYEELNDKVNKDDYATTSAAGLVKPDGTTVTVDADGTIHGASTYELPTASALVKGGIKVGDHLHMNGEVLSADGGIAVQDEEPTDVDVWVDTDEFGADFCYVGDEEPPNDGSVAVWVDTSEDERVSNIEVGDTTPTDDSVQIWVDTSQGANLADYIVEQGTSDNFKYRKWNSGLLEVDFSSSFSATTSSASGSMFWAQLPQVAIPEVCRSISNWSYFQTSIEATGYFVFIILRENTLQNFKCQIMAEQNRVYTGTYNLSYKGRWK